jgi:isopenicillin-N epimerase
MSSNDSRTKHALIEAHETLQEGRRRFFKVAAAGAGTIGTLGSALYSSPALAYGGPYAAAFSLDPGRTFMNIGTTGSTPVPVLKNLAANNALIARDPTQSFDTQDMRNRICSGFGADPFELVMSFNTTDGMNKILNGLSWSAGDEIITTNMEHPGGNSPLAVIADRFGVVLRRVNLPTGDYYSDAEVLNRFQALRTNKTKAIVFSSPPYLTGIRLPEKQLCQWAASQGLVSVIDGAHGPGMLALNMHDIGCDFYAGAGHKWQCGPGQTGILYVRNNNVANSYTKSVTIGGVAQTLTFPGYTNTNAMAPFYPILSGGYSQTVGSALQGGVRDPEDNIAATLMSIGNPSYPALRALQEVCSLWDGWGRKAIENYDVALAQYLRSRLAAIWGPNCMATVYDANIPHHAQIALTSFNPFSAGYDYNRPLTASEATAQTTASNAAVATLRDTHNVVVRNTAVPHSLRGNPTQNAADATTQSHPLRISTHLFHNMADVDNLVAKLLLVVPHP